MILVISSFFSIREVDIWYFLKPLDEDKIWFSFCFVLFCLFFFYLLGFDRRNVVYCPAKNERLSSTSSEGVLVVIVLQEVLIASWNINSGSIELTVYSTVSVILFYPVHNITLFLLQFFFFVTAVTWSTLFPNNNIQRSHWPSLHPFCLLVWQRWGWSYTAREWCTPLSRRQRFWFLQGRRTH